MLLTCKCGANCRIPSLGVRQRVRCGACKYVFTPSDLTRVREEPPPPPPSMEDLFEAIIRGAGGGIPNITGAPDEGDYDEEQDREEE